MKNNTPTNEENQKSDLLPNLDGLSVQDVAKKLRVSVGTVRRWIDEGKIEKRPDEERPSGRRVRERGRAIRVQFMLPEDQVEALYLIPAGKRSQRVSEMLDRDPEFAALLKNISAQREEG